MNHYIPWCPPFARHWLQSHDSQMFQRLKADECEIPVFPHLASFGVQRAHHMHEGIDLYCPAGQAVQAVEAGWVVGIEEFTGPGVGSPWWHQTWAVLVEGETGVVVYGEIVPQEGLVVGANIQRGQRVGHVKQVLAKDKGRPMSMLHLELHHHGTRTSEYWKVGDPIPSSLRDPTPYCRAWMNIPPHHQPLDHDTISSSTHENDDENSGAQ